MSRIIPRSEAGVTEDLATTLSAGNATSGSNIVISAGDALSGESSASVGGDLTLQAGTDTGAGPTPGGDVVLRPGSGVGLASDGAVAIQSADGLTSVRLASTGAEELTVGTTFQLIYDGTTGKLTVPGVLDPTALVLSDPAAGTDLYIESNDGQTSAAAPAGKGRIRYNGATNQWEASANGGAYSTISGGGGGGEDLAATLVLGNSTGGTDIEISAGDSIRSSTGTAAVATGTITINTAPLSAPGTDYFLLSKYLSFANKVESQRLTSVAGPRTSGLRDFDGSLGTPAAIAADIVAAVNDPANFFDTNITATDLGGGVVRIDAAVAGTAGNSAWFNSFLATPADATLSPAGGYLDGGREAGDPLILSVGTGAIQMDSGGDPRGAGAVDFQTGRYNPWEVAAGARSFVMGRYNFTRQPGSFVFGSNNRLANGSQDVGTLMFGKYHYADFGPKGHLIGGLGNYLYASQGTYDSYVSCYASVIWGGYNRFYNAGQPQASYGAYFGSSHRFEVGNLANTNLFAGFLHEVRSPGTYVGANLVFGNQHNLWLSQATLVGGEVNQIVSAASAIIVGENIFFDNPGTGGGAFGLDVAVTTDATFAFGGGHGLAGDGQFSLVSMYARTTGVTSEEMVLGDFTTTPTADSLLVVWPNSSWAFELTVSARQTAGSAGTVGDSATWKFIGQIKRDGSNNTALVGIARLAQVNLVDEAITVLVYRAAVGPVAPAFSDAGASTWTIEVTADDVTNEALRVNCTGQLNKTIRWEGYLRLSQAANAVFTTP